MHSYRNRFLLGLLVLSPIALVAQDSTKTTSVPRVVVQADSMAKLLALTPAQTERYRAILDSAAAQTPPAFATRGGFRIGTFGFGVDSQSMRTAQSRTLSANPGTASFIKRPGTGPDSVVYMVGTHISWNALGNPSGLIEVNPTLTSALRAILDDAQKATFDGVVKGRP